jgi:hypothetical protein
VASTTGLRVGGGLALVGLGLLVLLGACALGAVALFTSMLALGSMGGDLPSKGLVVLIGVLLTLLVVALGVFFILLGIRFIRTPGRAATETE